MVNTKLKEMIRTLARTIFGPVLEIAVYLDHIFVNRRALSSPDIKPAPAESRLPFPIDIVYTWVDDSDPDWQARKDMYSHQLCGSFSKLAASRARFHNRDELLYSLRSVSQFAPFVRHIYIVTDNQVPAWLNTEHPKITVISHRDILPADALPTFNSHAIEARLHHISSLAEHYIYLNDDVFLGKPANPLDFFTVDGLSIGYLSMETVPHSEPTSKDTDLAWSMKNNRRLIHSKFGKTIHAKLAHVPHSQKRSVLFEMEETYKPDFARTMHNRFRYITDISVASALYPYYAYFSNRGLLRGPSSHSYRYKYINIASPFLKPTLRRILLSNDYESFCINEPVDYVDTTPYTPVVINFLRSYFSNKCEFER